MQEHIYGNGKCPEFACINAFFFFFSVKECGIVLLKPVLPLCWGLGRPNCSFPGTHPEGICTTTSLSALGGLVVGLDIPMGLIGNQPGKKEEQGRGWRN